MSKKISYSAWIKYLICPKMYELHYNQNLRPESSTSALLFGSAMDYALNALLLKTADPFTIFKDNFTYEIFKDCTISKPDMQDWLFTEEQNEVLKGKDEHYKTWACMRIKGRILIEKYIEDVYPLLGKVYDVQGTLEGRKGFIDAIVDVRGHGKVLIDHKTSASPYKSDQVKHSTQLALYARDRGIDKIGYIVLIKAIYKTTRFPQVQLFVDNVSNHVQNITHESISDVEKLIDTGIFPRNLNACGKVFGKPCIYSDHCWKKGNKQ